MRWFKYFGRFLFWTVNRFLVILFIRPRFNVQIVEGSDSVPAPPYVLVANHGTFFDPWLIGSYSKYPMSIMMNDFGFKRAFFVRLYQKCSGAFPKKKGVSDYRALKIGLRELINGYPIMIFPEGQVTWDGETQPLFKGIEKIVKHFLVPIVMMNIKGSFLCKPWWAESYRKGTVRIKTKLLNTEQIKIMSEESILNEIQMFLYNNDVKDSLNKNTFVKGGNLAEGLTHLLWICKNCKVHDSLSTEGNILKCVNCGACWEIDSHANFKVIKGDEIGDLYDLVKWHKEEVKSIIEINNTNSQLSIDKDTEFCKINKNGNVSIVDRGTLKLTNQYLIFISSVSKKEIIKNSINDIKSIVFQKKEYLECRTANKVYFFRFKNGSTMKWVYYFKYLKQ